ncbi:MAG: hypothetical protein IPN20_03620 [Haliscomenobacter sp.]|nr:hypothetical protein [Haliscomenobacter sp.]
MARQYSISVDHIKALNGLSSARLTSAKLLHS